LKFKVVMEFHSHLSIEKLNKLISEKKKMFAKYHTGEYKCFVPHDDLVYRCYAEFNDIEHGSFELEKYTGMCMGNNIYDIYNECDCTKESTLAQEEKDFEDFRWRLERKFSKLTNIKLDVKIRALDLKPPRRKKEKIELLVSHFSKE